MADLSLIPNPQIMAIQTGVFLANLYVVKKLMLEPYLKVKEKRIELTIGNKESAQIVLKECEEKTEEIQTKVNSALNAASDNRKKVRSEALEKKENIVTQATQQASGHLEKMRQQMQVEIAKEKEKIESTVSRLTGELFTAVTDPS